MLNHQRQKKNDYKKRSEDICTVDEGEYVQNEEQEQSTLNGQPVKELDIPEPDKNEIILPDLPNT